LSILVLLFTFYRQVAGHGDSNVSCSLKVRIPVSFRVIDEGAPGSDVEIVESCFRLRLRWRWLTEVVACSGRTTLIIPPREILVLAGLFRTGAMLAGTMVW
jgi:hypothetical protein